MCFRTAVQFANIIDVVGTAVEQLQLLTLMVNTINFVRMQFVDLNTWHDEPVLTAVVLRKSDELKRESAPLQMRAWKVKFVMCAENNLFDTMCWRGRQWPQIVFGARGLLMVEHQDGLSLVRLQQRDNCPQSAKMA